MKLVAKQFAGMKFHTAAGLVTADANGEVEVADEATAKVLEESGFRPVFLRKSVEPKAEKVEPKADPVEPVEPKADGKKKG